MMSHQDKRNTRPEENAEWMALCADPQWKYQPVASDEEEQLFFAKDWDGEIGKEYIDEIVTPPPEMHRGALAPKFVLEVKEPLKEPRDDMMTYMRRLLCFLAGRFVTISRPDASKDEDLFHTKGVPRSGVRYWWRYWDNNQNVYQITMEKWRRCIPAQLDDYPGDIRGALPGEFIEKAWMRECQNSDMFGNSWGPVVTILSTFLENMWLWKHTSTTQVAEWDEALKRLEKSAGIST